MLHFNILIIGGGNAGISVAAGLRRKAPQLEIGIIEPSEKHYYQPAWTLVGGGTFDINDTVRGESTVIPEGVKWIKAFATAIHPESNMVDTSAGNNYSYDYLVVAPGIQLNWKDVEGLEEALGKYNVTSNYSFQTAPYTFSCIQEMQPGMTAIFTSPSTALKCGGAP